MAKGFSCDRCKKLFKGEPGYVAVGIEMIERPIHTFFGMDTEKDFKIASKYELCKSCFAGTQTYLENAIEAKEK